jgi:hypothetical protein
VGREVTDTLDAEVGAETEPVAGLACDQPGCDFVGETAQRVGYHKWRAHGIKKPPRPKRKPARDKAPRSVTVNLGAPKTTRKGDQELAAVEARVRQLLNLVSGALVMAGQLEDAGDVQRNRDSVAAALKELARYEPWLKKLAQGGEMGDRAMAWVAAIMAIAAMLIPICDRRGWIPEQVRPMLVQTFSAPVGVTSPDVSEPAAA